MAIAIHRTTKEVKESVNTPDFDTGTWVVLRRGDAGIAALRTMQAAGVPSRYIAIRGGDVLEEMTAGEKTTVEVANAVLAATSDAAADLDGIPAVDAGAVAFHTITIRKRGLDGRAITSGSETIRVIPETLVTTSTGSVALSSGVATFTVGPSLLRGDTVIRIQDLAGVLRLARIRVRFK
jgi:hypothetical protein